MTLTELEKKACDIRADVVTLIHKAGCGHIGGDMSEVEALVALYYKHLNCSPENEADPDRDRFVLSKGHSVETLYCILADRGYFDKAELMDTYSAYGSRFIGHPNNKIPGIEMNSGSLGHGLSVGWAWPWRASARGSLTGCMWSWGTASWRRAPCGKKRRGGRVRFGAGKLPDGQGPHRAGGHRRDPYRLRGAGAPGPGRGPSARASRRGCTARRFFKPCAGAVSCPSWRRRCAGKRERAGSRRWKRCSPGLGQNKSSRRSILCKWNVGTYWKSR